VILKLEKDFFYVHILLVFGTGFHGSAAIQSAILFENRHIAIGVTEVLAFMKSSGCENKTGVFWGWNGDSQELIVP